MHVAMPQRAQAAPWPAERPAAARCLPPAERRRQRRRLVPRAAAPEALPDSEWDLEDELQLADAQLGERRQRSEQQRDSELMEMWLGRLAGLPNTSRTVALLQLLRIEYGGAFSGLVGGSPGGRASKQGLDARDLRAVTELVNGVTRWRRRLDFTLSRFSRKPLSQLDPPLLTVLRMATYELVEARAPPHIINEHVSLVKAVVHQGAAAVANGTLRNIVRAMEAGTLPQPPPPGKGMSFEAAADALAEGTSHPTWMVAGWLRQYGPSATMALLQSNNTRPRYALRLAAGTDPAALCAKLESIGVQARPSAFLPREFVVVGDNMQAMLHSGLVARGEAQVQDEAAGLVVALLDPQPGENILDACAAPGGKALFAAARMRGQGRVIALDVAPSRLAALRDTARRQQHGRTVWTVAGDLRQFAAAAAERRGQEGAAGAEGAAAGAAAGDLPHAEQPEPGWQGPAQYDRVLLDAPCSGTGVLAKRADLRWKRTQQQVATLVGLQAELLDAAAALVRPGGLLVYSTCSIERAENEAQVEAFLQRHPEFVAEAPPEGLLPKQCLSAAGQLAMLPHVHGTDGAFAARLRRRDAGAAAP